MDHWCIKNVIHAGLALRLASWKHAGDPLIIDRQTNGLSRSFCKMTILILKQSELKLRIAGELKVEGCSALSLFLNIFGSDQTRCCLTYIHCILHSFELSSHFLTTVDYCVFIPGLERARSLQHLHSVTINPVLN